MTAPDITELRPEDMFFHLIVASLAPFFATTAGGNLNLANLAALDTMEIYRARGGEDLLPIGQHIAFSLATLNSLNRSMASDLSDSRVLRLRGNAVSMSKAGEGYRRILQQPVKRRSRADYLDQIVPAAEWIEQPTVQSDQPVEHIIDPPEQVDEPAKTIAATPKQVEQPAETIAAAPKQVEQTPAQLEQPIAIPKAPAPRHQTTAKTPSQSAIVAAPAIEYPVDQTTWAQGMTRAAAACFADLKNLPPEQHKAASMRANVLSTVAQDLLCGVKAPIPANLTQLNPALRNNRP